MPNGLESLRGFGAHIAQRLADAGFSGIDNVNRWKMDQQQLIGAELGNQSAAYTNSIAPELLRLKQRGMAVDEGTLGDKQLRTVNDTARVPIENRNSLTSQATQAYNAGPGHQLKNNNIIATAANSLHAGQVVLDGVQPDGSLNFGGLPARVPNAINQYVTNESRIAGGRRAAQNYQDLKKEDESARRFEGGHKIANNLSDPTTARADVDKQYPKGTTPVKRGTGAATEEARTRREAAAFLRKRANTFLDDPQEGNLIMRRLRGGPKADNTPYTAQDMLEEANKLDQTIQETVKYKGSHPAGQVARDAIEEVKRLKGYASDEDLTDEDDAMVLQVVKQYQDWAKTNGR